MGSAKNEVPSLDDLLNSPEFKALAEAWQASERITAAEDQAWWDSLSMEERARAFRQVAKLIYHAEVAKRGSYRYAIYDVFDVDYGDGLAHYMTLHNLIYQGLEAKEHSQTESVEDCFPRQD